MPVASNVRANVARLMQAEEFAFFLKQGPPEEPGKVDAVCLMRAFFAMNFSVPRNNCAF